MRKSALPVSGILLAAYTPVTAAAAATTTTAAEFAAAFASVPGNVRDASLLKEGAASVCRGRDVLPDFRIHTI